MKKNDPTPDNPPNPIEDVLGGGIRGETAGCPTGLSQPPKPRPKDEKTPEADPPVDRDEGRGAKR